MTNTEPPTAQPPQDAGDTAASEPAAPGAGQSYTTTYVERPSLGERIAFVIILLLVVFLVGGAGYVLLSGTLAPSAPRTAAERQLRTLETVVAESPEDSASRAEYARALIAAGQYTTAERVIETSLDTIGYEPELLVEQARLLHVTGEDGALIVIDDVYTTIASRRETQAEERAARGITGSLTDPLGATLIDAALLEAGIHAEGESWQQAIAAYGRALAEDPTMADVLVLRGQAFVAIGSTDEARADFESALRYAPDYDPARAALASLEGEAE